MKIIIETLRTAAKTYPVKQRGTAAKSLNKQLLDHITLPKENESQSLFVRIRDFDITKKVMKFFDMSTDLISPDIKVVFSSFKEGRAKKTVIKKNLSIGEVEALKQGNSNINKKGSILQTIAEKINKVINNG